MPWRATRDPYRVWVSEIMLQQTTVRTAIPYYERFVEAFPTVEALAQAPLGKVLRAWEGLGYYARARRLHAAAREIVARRGGRLPDTAADLAALPGIGRSTAGAIAAIAFGRDAAVLDANVARVVARLFAVRGDTGRAAVRRLLWRLAEYLVLPGRGRETALAFMDLGSLLCTPGAPRCGECPARRFCLARREGAQEAIPARRARPAGTRPRVEVAVALVEDPAGRLFVRRRPEEGLLGGLWAFPGSRVRPGEPAQAAALRAAAACGERPAGEPRFIGTVDHAYSHYAVRLHGFRFSLPCAPPAGPGARWVRPADLGRYPFAISNRRLLALAGGAEPFRGEGRGGSAAGNAGAAAPRPNLSGGGAGARRQRRPAGRGGRG